MGNRLVWGRSHVIFDSSDVIQPPIWICPSSLLFDFKVFRWQLSFLLSCFNSPPCQHWTFCCLIFFLVCLSACVCVLFFQFFDFIEKKYFCFLLVLWGSDFVTATLTLWESCKVNSMSRNPPPRVPPPPTISDNPKRGLVYRPLYFFSMKIWNRHLFFFIYFFFVLFCCFNRPLESAGRSEVSISADIWGKLVEIHHNGARMLLRGLACDLFKWRGKSTRVTWLV